MTASAADSVNPPPKTDTCASADCSAGDSRSHDQSSVAFRVACRSRRFPLVTRTLKRELIRCNSTRGGMMRARAAASSMASGNRSRRFTSGPMAAWSSVLYTPRTPRARTRCTNIRVASSLSRGANAIVCSPTMPRTSRLVAIKRASGARSSQLPSVASACRATCSKLSRIIRHCLRAAIALPTCCMGSPFPSDKFRPCATAWHDAFATAGA